ncbi:2-oxo-4-hydroxy-4-carboxy-5-ureidoimidazoline decarboxylase [Chromatocurvus halotolerans]|uniref:2-oxo-4-hydroxy-4-carboxy-5-ureidoimidazoline decarboxylase n=1 Tax=Chromatocurvus halotolerans TaxID=1132028 RepID=A0A4R2KWH7_9GAMM|nr:2-oxo-4-hydroxy-4-carboxy-5-ureidoimidazoline decarboxylase [Chromatocurvus halotolerans]TCO78243.1 2-oxo-4-hydroxy-4-carboxy-5-ureidoimidazoline decarboxylase [Chromatocurvus halotolerans]
MTLADFNAADTETASQALARCCSCRRWVEALVQGRPYADLEALRDAADRVWTTLGDDDYLEAFAGHPQIGDMDSLHGKSAETRSLAAQEQAGVLGADDAILRELAHCNAEYFRRFGFIFIVCASGRSVEEMLHLMQSRMAHSRHEEIAIAAEEQRRIFHRRIGQLL